MSDNISADEVKRRLVIFLRIPAEVWTDIFKLLPRRVLVQIVSPVCFRFKEICNKNVKNIHVIKNAGQFCYILKEDDPEANQQLERLASNKCHLADQFRLTFLTITEKSQAILRSCLDLFNGCKIHLWFSRKNKGSTVFLECLGQLEESKPVQIDVLQHADQVIDFWHHPIFMNCTRVLVNLNYWPSLSAATLTTAYVNIFEWLHRQPTEMDCNGAADQQQVRCMIVHLNCHEHIDLLLHRCSEKLQQGQGPSDRRPFVFSFKCWVWPGFDQFQRVENKSTGEVLLLDRVMHDNAEATYRLYPIYRLRRCLAEEEVNGPAFYAGMFKWDRGFEEFNIDNDNKKTPEVKIR